MNNNQTTSGKVGSCNPGIYAGGCGRPSRLGCLAGMRGFEPIEEFSTSGSIHAFRAARSMSPQKGRPGRVHYEPFRPYRAQYDERNAGNLQVGQVWPSRQDSFFNEGGYPQSSHQVSRVDEELPRRASHEIQFQAAPAYEVSPTNQTNRTKDAGVVETPPKNAGSAMSPKNELTPSTSDHNTPSTSDHSDVDDLVPRSIHSPSTDGCISDPQPETPPSSRPGSPAVSTSKPHSLQDSGNSSDNSEKPKKTKKLPVKEEFVKKSPFASLDLQDRGVVKARSCARNAQMLNKSLTGECRSLEDEMSELTKDLEALREQLKNHRGP